MTMDSTAIEDRSDRAPGRARPGGAKAPADKSDFDRLAHKRIGAAIRKRRRLLGLSLRQLAAACGMSLQQVQKYEVGGSSISAAQLWRMAGALAVPVEHFYNRADPRP
jgi:hypothetical protein